MTALCTGKRALCEAQTLARMVRKNASGLRYGSENEIRLWAH
jgi:hypothetical protein